MGACGADCAERGSDLGGGLNVVATRHQCLAGFPADGVVAPVESDRRAIEPIRHRVDDDRLGGVGSFACVARAGFELAQALLAAVEEVGAGEEVGIVPAGAFVEGAVDQAAQDRDVRPDSFSLLARVGHAQFFHTAISVETRIGAA